jgi:hypothetical protein
MQFQLTKATKEQAKARIALIGPSGSGKTYSALQMAKVFGERVAVIDTENRSASKYADLYEFETLPLDEYSPATFTAAIKFCESQGVDVIVLDSLSHAWMGKGGALEQVDTAAKKYNNNSFMAWRDVTPQHNALVDTLVHCKCHLIVTMRSKMEYVIDKDEKTGKSVPKKLGLAPIQRDGLEYEFDVVGDINLDHDWIISKTRCSALDGKVISRPGEDVAEIIKGWLTAGSKPVAPAAQNPVQGQFGKSTEKSAEKPTGNQGEAHKSLSPAQIKRFYAIVGRSGASTDIAKLIIDDVLHGKMCLNPVNGKVMWEYVTKADYDKLCTLFESGEWEPYFQNMMDSDGGAHDLDKVV